MGSRVSDHPAGELEPQAKRPKFAGDLEKFGTGQRVELNPADCNLDFTVELNGLQGHALFDGGFGYCWSGARATFGITGGKYCFGCRVISNQLVHMEDTPPDQHVCRLGISRGDDDVGNLGESEHSFGYGGTGKFSTASKFSDYGVKFGVGDTIVCSVDLDSRQMCSIGFSKNGHRLGTAKQFDAGPTGLQVSNSSIGKLTWESAIFPHVLLKNVVVQMQFSMEDGLVPEEGYKPWNCSIKDGNAIRGPDFHSLSDCEVIMMVGLPASGKSTWAKKWVKDHPEKRHVLLGTNLALDQMKVPGLMRKHNYGERFHRLMDRATQIFCTLLARASKTPRNYILDQTNVYKSARRRKMQPFINFHKIAVVVFPTPDELKIRAAKRFKEMGKEVPAEAVNEMLANFLLPMSKDMHASDELFDEVLFAELNREDSQRYLNEMKSELRNASEVTPYSRRTSAESFSGYHPLNVRMTGTSSNASVQQSLPLTNPYFQYCHQGNTHSPQSSGMLDIAPGGHQSNLYASKFGVPTADASENVSKQRSIFLHDGPCGGYEGSDRYDTSSYATLSNNHTSDYGSHHQGLPSGQKSDYRSHNQFLPSESRPSFTQQSYFSTSATTEDLFGDGGTMASLSHSPSKVIRSPGGGCSPASRSAAGQTLKFARRTSSGRYISLSRDDLDMSGEFTGDYLNYTVQIPPTPDNQPMEEEEVSLVAKAEEQYVSSSLFTGGFNSVTRAHLMDKVVDSEATRPLKSGTKGLSTCNMPACDGKVMRNERGEDIYPCECRFKICRDCFIDAQKDGGQCPGCKELYKADEFDDGISEFIGGTTGALQLPFPGSSGGQKVTDRRMSVMKSNKSLLMRNQKGDFDHNRWLFETKGTYGYGNAFWPKEEEEMYREDGSEGDLGGGPMSDVTERPWKPLTRVIPIPAAIISPYRLLIVVRLVVLAFFLRWRLLHPNEEAPWLWGMSVVCEIWFAFSWILDQMPKLCPIDRATDLCVLKDKFEMPSLSNPTGRSDLPGVDFFVSTADPEKEPPLVTANTILSILAIDYPVEKLACYVSDDGGALLTFEAMAEAASFADIWVPFCRKHDIEPRNPDSYFNTKGDPTKNKRRSDFVKDRRRVKREYDEFKVRINGLPDSIRRRSDAFNAREEMKLLKHMRESGADPSEPIKVQKATWMADGTHWPGTWASPNKEHAKGDHAGILQVMLKPPSCDPLTGCTDDDKLLDFTDVDVRLPMLAYVSREKRPGYDHNKKAGAMNALVRASAVMSNGPFILNLDCDHYIYNSQALREGMCFMMDRGGEDICYIQFPQRFEGIDPSDRYANHNTVFFDGNMRALDGLQGPVYVGTGCLFRRFALYGFDPPTMTNKKKARKARKHPHEDTQSLRDNMGSVDDEEEDELRMEIQPKRFGNSTVLLESIVVAEFQGRPLADHPGVQHGRPPGVLRMPREPLDAASVAEAVSVISCWYEDKTEWGDRVGWIYGSVTEDVVTGYRMHNRGWRSIYCITKRDAFRGSAPINLTDRLHQVLRWATGSVEIFFSRNNAFLASSRMNMLQRLAYLNVGIYPFTSIFLLVYCFLPALSLFSGHFIVRTLSVAFLVYLLTITICLVVLAILEVKWSGIELEEWWRNEQFWLIGGTSAHLYAVVQGLLKVVAGIEISFTLTSKSAGDDNDDIYADLYIVKWTSLMIPPITIMMVNLIAIAVAFSRTIYSETPQWSKLIGGIFFSFWVLAHLYPFAKGLMGRRGRTPTIVFVWSGLIAITISLLWVAINPPKGAVGQGIGGGGFQFP